MVIAWSMWRFDLVVLYLLLFIVFASSFSASSKLHLLRRQRSAGLGSTRRVLGASLGLGPVSPAVLYVQIQESEAFRNLGMGNPIQSWVSVSVKAFYLLMRTFSVDKGRLLV